jgi:Na+-driven multidrug efflux pump
MQVRSFFNNTKEIVTFVCAVRIGVLEAAVFSMFDSLGTFAYGVPNILATPAMFYGSNLYGQGRYRDFSRLLLFFAAMAVAFAVIFLILGLLTFSSTAPELFANRVQVRVRAECVLSAC